MKIKMPNGTLMESNAATQQEALAQQDTYFSDVDNQAVNLIKDIENPATLRAGWDEKKQLWFPHSSPEGGSDTIGYGHKIITGEDFSNGLTEDEVLSTFKKDWLVSRKDTKAFIQGNTNIDWDTLPDNKRNLLTDVTFNAGGLKNWPKLLKAVEDDDDEEFRKQYSERTFKDDKGKRKSLKSRTDPFLKLLLGDQP